jgi:histone H3/H4
MTDLPGAAVKRLVSKNGGDLRISASALQLAVQAAEEYIARLAREAGASASKDRRKTIMDTDIRNAREAVG